MRLRKQRFSFTLNISPDTGQHPAIMAGFFIKLSLVTRKWCFDIDIKQRTKRVYPGNTPKHRARYPP